MGLDSSPSGGRSQYYPPQQASLPVLSDHQHGEIAKLVADLPMHRPWSIRSLIAHLSLDRDRPISIQPLPTELGAYCTAAWVSKPLLDTIYIRTDLDPTHEEVAIAHELGHILLAHTLSDHDRVTYLQQMFPAVPPAFLPLLFGTPCTPLTRSNYEHPFEWQAEWFARLLISRADAYRSGLLPDGRRATDKQQRILDRAAAAFGWP